MEYQGLSALFNNSLSEEENTRIYSTTEHHINKLAQKNHNLRQLIDAFDLVDENGMETRNLKTD